MSGLTVVHVTHEGVDHIGGIGTVLEGLMTSPVYRGAVGRSIIVGTLPYPDRQVADPRERLGEHATVCRYSGPDHFDPEGLGSILRPIEWAFGVKIVYGTRVFRETAGRGGPNGGSADVLLIDVSHPNPERLGALKWQLYQKFGIDSRRFEGGWDYEEWCRLADPAYHALCALLGSAETPAVVISHEFMGMCTALRCHIDRQRFRTVFHAHECSTARRIVEHLPALDVAFYPAMRAAQSAGKHVEDVFGDQSGYARHALVSRTHLLDAILAVGPETAEELRFLSTDMQGGPVRVAFNGLPAPRVTAEAKRASRRKLDAWLEKLIGFRPDYLFTHVTRPVPSKGLWRDQKIGMHLEPHLRKMGKTAAYVLLTCGAPIRSTEQVTRMAGAYNWPAQHREGYPDLDGPEVQIYRSMQAFNEHRHAEMGGAPCAGEPGCMRAILVNQFGFTRDRLGPAAPEGMTIDDLRRAADVELGMSTYEPFGIAHLEALHAGAICVPSTVCGCLGLVRRAMGELGMREEDCPIVLAVDFTDEHPADPVHVTAAHRNAVEERVCKAAAEKLAARLPRTEADRERYLQLGQRLADRMSWDVVCETDILPVLAQITGRAAEARAAR